MSDPFPPSGLRSAPAALNAFAFRRSVFTLAEFLEEFPDRSEQTARAQLGYAVKCGRLWRIKRDLYVDLDGSTLEAIASRWTDDAVLAYETAFAIHFGRSRSAFRPARFLTQRKCRPLLDADGAVRVAPVRLPRALSNVWMHLGTTRVDDMRVTAPWRTIVDVLDRIDLAPPMGAIWPALVNARPDPLEMIDYALKLPNRLAGARLGFFLDHWPGLTDRVLWKLPAANAPTYLDRARRGTDNAFYPRRNLMIPLRAYLQVERTDFRFDPPRLPEDDTLPEEDQPLNTK